MEEQQILLHEKAHARQLHSIDILLSQLLSILLWFNPFAWLYKQEIVKNLEYLADEMVTNSGVEKQSYQYLLLKSITGQKSFGHTNQFYNSLIKNRITMLQKQKSKKINGLKFALVLPLIIGFMMVFQTTTIAQEKQNIFVEQNMFVKIITKDFQKADFEKMVNDLKSKGVDLKYKNLKYNSNKEIISIELIAKSKTSTTSINQKSTVPINPIKISFDDKGGLSMGNISPDMHGNFLVEGGTGQKEITIKKIGGENVYTISGDKINEDGNVIFISKDDQNPQVINIKEKNNMVWVNTEGDSIKTSINVMDFEEKDGMKYKVIIEKEGDVHASEHVIIQNDGKKEKKMMFISANGKEPLVMIDGKEESQEKLNGLSPDQIEKMEVFKGVEAVKKYGEKAKDGVIVITTKK